METFITTLHILIAVVLIGLVLVQDPKSGAMGVFGGGGGSNSVLGATGAATLAQKLTRYIAFGFAITCIALSWSVNRKSKSVIDNIPAATTTAPAPQAPGAPNTQPAPQAPAGQETQPQTK